MITRLEELSTGNIGENLIVNGVKMTITGLGSHNQDHKEPQDALVVDGEKTYILSDEGMTEFEAADGYAKDFFRPSRKVIGAINYI